MWTRNNKGPSDGSAFGLEIERHDRLRGRETRSKINVHKATTSLTRSLLRRPEVSNASRRSEYTNHNFTLELFQGIARPSD